MRLVLIAILFFSMSAPTYLHAEVPSVLIIVGPSRHPPGSHEVEAGGRVMKYCLENIENGPELRVNLTTSWPEDQSLLDSAATVVFIGDTFPANRFPDPKQNLADLGKIMQRGCGIVCVHYATGLLGEDVSETGEHPLLNWMGGYFANRSCPHHTSIARIYEAATITPAAPEHPVMQGWEEFTIHDEPYINNYFSDDGNKLAPNVTALATSMLPPENPQKETVAWSVEREDSGRGFGIVMPHFYKNWRNENLRKFILNGIVWTAKQEIPQQGIETTLPPLERFEPASVEFVRKK